MHAAIPFLGGAGIVAVILYFFWNELVFALSKTNFLYLFLAFLVYVFVLMLWCVRWRIFIKKRISVAELMPILLAGISVNCLTPLAKAGGEPVRAYILKVKTGLSFSESMASTLSELVTEFLSQLLLVLLSFPLILLFFSLPPWAVAGYCAFVLIYVAIALGIIALQDEMKINRLFTWLSFKSKRFSVSRARIAKKFFAFQSSFKNSLKDKKKLAQGVCISIVSKILEALKLVIIFWALGERISILTALIIIAFALIIASIPATPGSLGIMEGGLVSFLIILGIPRGAAAAAVLIDRVITFWLPLLFGALSLYRYGISLKLVKRLRKGAP